MRRRGEGPRGYRQCPKQRRWADRSGHWTGSVDGRRGSSSARKTHRSALRSALGPSQKPKGPSCLEEHRRDRQMRGCRALHRNWGHRPVRLCREARGLRRPGSSSRTERRSGLRKRNKQKGKPLYPFLYGCVTAAIRGGRSPPAGRLFDRLKGKGKHRKALRSPVCFGLVAIVYGCWSNGERFDPQERLRAPQEQKRQYDPNESDRDSGTNRDLSAPISQREATQRKKAPCPQKSGSFSDRGQGAFP